ncbi:hypothetical protein NDU88_002653 [Pleurodeles waltl]|uniref:Uncharacterized protein n=1 Tax=Pleurodeles waltl TaxID=8319 RepID=A0AAV7Q6M5_PLEWA|nr:hypothetical protein NDU88_002653 [Pleurodeles waltl]
MRSDGSQRRSSASPQRQHGNADCRAGACEHRWDSGDTAHTAVTRWCCGRRPALGLPEEKPWSSNTDLLGRGGAAAAAAYSDQGPITSQSKDYTQGHTWPAPARRS